MKYMELELSHFHNVRGIGHEHEREFWPGLDFLRVIGCLAVITLHTSAIYFYSYNDLWAPTLLLNSFSRMAVPIFFMLTGFFILDSQLVSLKSFYAKRYIRILLPFIILCIIYFFTPQYNKYSIWEYIVYCLTHSLQFHLWYIYALLGIYAIIPFFIIILKTKYAIPLVKFYIFVWILMYIIFPTLKHIFNLKINIIIDLHFFSGYFGYVLLGWYIKYTQIFKNINDKQFIFIFIFSSLLIFFSTALDSYMRDKPNTFFLTYMTPWVFLQAISIFFIFKNINYTNIIIRIISKLSYWIYLIHAIILNNVKYVIIDFLNMHSFTAVFYIILITFILSIIISLPLLILEKYILCLLKKFIK